MDLHEFQDVFKQCRCCFKTFSDEEQILIIDEAVEMRFFDVTQLNLIKSPNTLNRICLLCDQKLREFSILKKNFIEKQLRFYGYFPFLNAEPEEELVCKVELEDESLNFVEIKQEIESEDDFYHGHPTLEDQRIEAPTKVENSKKQIGNVKSKAKKSPVKSEKARKKNSKKFQCDQCGIFTATKQTRDRHVDIVHKKIRNFFCDSCDFSTYFKHSIEDHVFKHLEGTSFNCELCNYTGSTALSIALHKKYNHDKGDKQLTLRSILCDLCGKSFSRPALLIQHLRLTHEKRRDKVCKFCDKRFSCATGLKYHILHNHTSDHKKKFTCEVCSKTYWTSRQLQMHKIYHEEPKFICDFGCGKKSFTRWLLKNHHKTHLQQRDYVCEVPGCEQKYYRSSHLKNHVKRAHEKVKDN